MKTFNKALSLMSLATVGASSFLGESPVDSFLRMSPNLNDWDRDSGISWIACVIGFCIFIVTYLFVVVALFHDVLSKIREYAELIEDDKKTLKSMDYNIENPDFLKALDNRIKGIKEDEGADD